jgi:urea ABC transporter urea binding protein
MTKTIEVGILHSLSGSLATGELPLRDAALMAIAEINQTGGVLGHRIQPIIKDGASEPQIFQQQAQSLIHDHSISHLFGCWTSACRKAVLPVVEAGQALLWYPLQYEGLECSQNIFYTGACPNQQLEPAVKWLVEQNHQRIYLLGMDYVFPRIANKIVKAHLKKLGGSVVGETYAMLNCQDFQAIIADIQRSQPDAVFNTLNGDSNIAFYQQYKAAGITANQIPIMAVSMAENLLQQIGENATGHYATWTYFQSLDTPENQKFVKNFQDQYGVNQVVSDPAATAYSQIYLWKQAVEQAGSFAVEQVRQSAHGQSFNSPAGLIKIESHHLWKNWFVGEALPTGQFKIRATSEHPIKPQPWLGIDDLSFDNSELVIDLLAEVSQSVQYISQLSQKSQELSQTNHQLHQTVTTLKNTQLQLIQTEKMSSLGQLVAGIAHEINNPVSFIYGNLPHVNHYVDNLFAIVRLYQRIYPDPSAEVQQELENLELDFITQDLPQLTKSMRMGADRIRNIVLSLRNFSRLDEAALKAVDLHEGIDSTLLILQNRLKAVGDRPAVKVVKSYGDLPPVECHSSQVNQVLMNIISNALDALEESQHPSPVIEIQTQVENDRRITICISDNGSGIPESAKQKLFDPFFTTKPIGKGTGLGLSISYQIIVEKHGGSLRCESQQGEGTQFWIELPIAFEGNASLQH